MALLTVNNLNTFRGGLQVLFDAKLEINPGEIAFLYGRNGAGKSTLIGNIVGVLPAAYGSIVFDGTELIEEEERHPEKVTSIVSRAANLGIGWVPEDKRIFPNLTVMENLRMGTKPGKPKGYWNIDNVFDHFPTLTKISSRMGFFLSGGEKQLLSIARALMGNPRLVLLDEPSEGLSSAIIQVVTATIEKLREQKVAVVIAEQNLDFIEKFNSRLYFIHLGAVRFNGTVAEFQKEKAAGKFAGAFL